MTISAKGVGTKCTNIVRSLSTITIKLHLFNSVYFAEMSNTQSGNLTNHFLIYLLIN